MYDDHTPPATDMIFGLGALVFAIALLIGAAIQQRGAQECECTVVATTAPRGENE